MSESKKSFEEHLTLVGCTNTGLTQFHNHRVFGQLIQRSTALSISRFRRRWKKPIRKKDRKLNNKRRLCARSHIRRVRRFPYGHDRSERRYLCNMLSRWANNAQLPSGDLIVENHISAGTESRTSFEAQNQESNEGGFINEFRLLLKENKKWWITPIIICLLLFGVLIIAAGSSAAPFIYTLF